ncbi:unnamed protein product [Symbiodinium natans]|uniref:Uncharacterized protein n=1 Tax=Symbiodinium natans TaxID=878477 RepID=A0A812MFD3_9DINO|nr:unnamed protein product [Symbiodinium natans]
MAEEEEERRKERARRQEEEFGCAIAGGFEKGDFVLAQNNMSVNGEIIKPFKPYKPSKPLKTLKTLNLDLRSVNGEIIVKKGTRGVVRPHLLAQWRLREV